MQFVTTLLVAACFITQAVVGQCPNGVRDRKEIRTLSDAEWTAFVNALKSTMSGSAPTTYDRFAKVHIDNQRTVHNLALFFTWHRYYLREFEKELQKSDPNVMLPYWNWAFDSQAPEKSIVFHPERLGGNGKDNGCVTDGAFANWQPYYPSPHCLQRQFDAGDRINSFYSSDVITRTISQSQSYDALRRAIEFAPHGSVHVGCGGDMALMQSPNDPIFWLHHGYIDKIYARWQQVQPAFMQDYGGTNADGSRATANDALPSYPGARVRDTFDTKALCYTYAELPADSATVPQEPSSSTATAAGVKPSQNQGTSKPTTTTTTTTQAAAPTPTQASQQTHHHHHHHRHLFDRLARRGPGDQKAPIDTNVGVPGDDRSNLVALRIPRPLPKAWLDMNNKMPEPEVRDHEAKYAKITDQINAIDGYIPPCSLWLREDLLESLKGEVNKFYGTVHGQYVETTEIKTTVTIKETVRQQCGGSVRVETDQYKDQLLKIIGTTALPPPTSAAYPFTKPKSNEKVIVSYNKT